LPSDFVTCEKESLEKLMSLSKSGSKEEPLAGSKMQDSKLSGSHQVMEQADNMNMTVEMERYEQLGIDSSFTPKHWTDAKLFLGQT